MDDWVCESSAKHKMDEELENQKAAEQRAQGQPQSKVSFEEMLKVMEMAYAQMLQGRFDEAEEIVSAFLALISDFWYFHSLMGVIHLQAVLAEHNPDKYNLELAEEALNKAFELNPHDVSTYVNRAEVRLHKGDLDGAFEILKQVSVIDPELKDPYTARARQFTLEVLYALERLEAGEAPSEEVEAD